MLESRKYGKGGKDDCVLELIEWGWLKEERSRCSGIDPCTMECS